MFKKFLASVALATLTVSSAFACWVTQENFNNAYIAGVNYFQSHYEGVSDLNSARYINGQSVSLPLTCWFKVSPRTYTDNGVTRSYDIRVAKLYYKVIPQGDKNNTSAKWRLAKSIDMGPNPRWRMNFNSPVKLFGNVSISKDIITSNGDTISAGDHIVMVWYLADNANDSIANGDEITAGNSEPYIYPENEEYAYKNGSLNVFANDFTPAYIMRVVYNGMTTPGL